VPHPSRNAATTNATAITTIDYNVTMAGSGDADKSTVSEETVFSPASRLSRKPSILSTPSTTNTTTTTTTIVGNNSSSIRGSSADSIHAQLQLEQLMQSSEKLLQEKNQNHPTSTATGTNSPNSSNINNEDIPDISIVHLDESFKLEVDALEAESAQQATLNNNANSSTGNVTKPTVVVSSSNGRGSPYPGPPSSQGSSPGHPTTGKECIW